MIKSIFRLYKKYVARPLSVKFIMGLLMMAFSLALLGFSGEWDIGIDGNIFGTKVFLNYKNKSEILVAIFLSAIPLALAVWLYLRESRNVKPMSSRIHELEDAYATKGSSESVCQLFREVYGVYVSPGELDHIMSLQEKSLFATHLKNSRRHVVWKSGNGFSLIYNRIVYTFMVMLLTVLYFFFSILCVPLVIALLVSLVSQAWELFFKFGFVTASFIYLAYYLLGAFAAFNSSLVVVGETGKFVKG